MRSTRQAARLATRLLARQTRTAASAAARLPALSAASNRRSVTSTVARDVAPKLAKPASASRSQSSMAMAVEDYTFVPFTKVPTVVSSRLVCVPAFFGRKEYSCTISG